MLENYLPIAIFIIIAGVLGLLMLGLGFLFGKGVKTKAKLSPYECGFEEFEDARIPFDVRYYLVAILFIIFDLEIAFLFPWAIALDEIGHVGLISMVIFSSCFGYRICVRVEQKNFGLGLKTDNNLID
jgi:NADH:ubiquinone oxidoreductase subunit 3 (chain A)